MNANLNHRMQVKGIEIDADIDFDLPVNPDDMRIKRTTKGVNLQRALAQQPMGEAYFTKIQDTHQCRETYHNQLAAYNAKFAKITADYNRRYSFGAAMFFYACLALGFYVGVILVLKYM